MAVCFLVCLLAGVLRAEEVVVETDVRICAADLARCVGTLASDVFEGRETATEGGRRAGAWIAAEMERAGLEGGGPNESYFQPFVVAKPLLGPHNRLTASVLGVRSSYPVERDWNPFALSRSGTAEGALVFAGYGITAPGRRWDDYAGVDVRGKVVLVLRKDPGWGDARHAAFTAKLANAAKHGAAAILLCNDPATTRGAKDVLWPWDAPAGGRSGAGTIPFAFISQRLARSLLAPLGKDLEDLERELRASGPRSSDVPDVSVGVCVDLGRTTEPNARNVVGLLRGRDASVSDEVVVVGGHFDHLGRGRFGSVGGPAARGTIHPGADDNASGVATVLELAAYFAHGEARPRRSILFLAFAGEEMGLLGSRHYVSHPLVPLEKTVAMINCDMVGRSKNGDLMVGGGGTGRGLRALVDRANAERGLSIRHNLGGAAPSDSLPFFRKRIPVLFFFTGVHDDYHRPSDTADRIDYAAHERVSLLVRDTVAAIANADERLLYTDPPAPRRRARLGIGLADASDAEGVPVGSVVAGGPAAKAGVRAGDLIVALGGHVIRSRSDLMGALGQVPPGRQTQIVVLRAEARVPLTIVPGSGRGGGR